MKPTTKPANYDTDPIDEICAPLSATIGPRSQDGKAYVMNPKALENRVADIRKSKQRREIK